MKEAVEEEKQHAIKNENIDENRVPLVTVIADGCAAAIVGSFKKKVLWIGYRRKFCGTCKNIKDMFNYECNIKF